MVQSPIKACLAALTPSSEEEDDDDDDEEEDLLFLLLFNRRSPSTLRASVVEKRTVARKSDAIEKTTKNFVD